MSHHSSDDSGDQRHSEMEKKFHEALKETLGEFPNGKLNDRDEGAIPMAVETENGVIKLVFPKPVAWVGFTPEQAVQLANDLIKHARRSGHMPFVITL